MATIYTRNEINGKRYYINIVVGKKRIRRFAGYSLDVAKANLKKLEYDLTFNQIGERSSKLFDKSLTSYMDYISTTNIKPKQVKVIQSKNLKFREEANRVWLEPNDNFGVVIEFAADTL